MNSLKESKQVKQFCASQRQAIVKLLEKPKKIKGNWKYMSSQSFDLEIISKSLATRVKKVIANLIDASKVAHVMRDLLVIMAV